MTTDAREDKPADLQATPDGLTAGQALTYAWGVWLALIGLILVGMIAALWILFMGFGRDVNAAAETPSAGFYVGLGLLALSMGGFFVKRVYHGNYFRGRSVAPDDYLKGMLAIWLPMGAAALASLTLTVYFANAFPTPVPAVMGTILLFIFLPNGHAMTQAQRGGTDDPGSYEEPK